MTLYLGQLRRALRPAAFCLATAVVCVGAEPARRIFDLPAEDAERTLKRFAAQSGREVVFASGVVAGVRTQAVKGEMTPREALEALLAQTKLVATQDAATGAFMINRVNDPNAPRAAQLPPGRARPEPNPTRAETTPSPMTTHTSTPALTRVLGAAAAMFGAAAGGAAQPAGSAPATSGAVRHEMATVTGRVSNAATGQFLRGAILTVDGVVSGATTDRSGEFSVIVPAGRHTIAVAFAGLKELEQSVEAGPGAAVRADFALVSDIYKLEKYVVAGLREGQAAALQNERQSMNMKSVAAIDAFGNPGASVGELMQRLPGVAVDVSAGSEPSGIYVRGLNHSFGSMMVDGNQLPNTDGTSIAGTNTYLGQVSSSNLESLEIVKAALPEMDGNAISGYINLRTRRAFDRAPGRLVTLSAGTKWADLDQHPTVPGRDRPRLDLLSLTYAEVFSIFGGTHNLGVSASVNQNTVATYLHEAGPSLATGNSNQTFFAAPPAPGAPIEPLVRGWSSGHWNNSARPNPVETYGLNVDFKAGDGTVLYVKFTASDTRTDITPSYFRWRLTAAQAASSFLPGSTYDVVSSAANAGTVELESTLYIRESLAYGYSAGFEKKFFNRTGTLSFDSNYGTNRTTYPSINEARARLTGVGFEIDRRGRDEWLPRVAQTAGPNWSDPRNYQIIPSAAAGSRILTYRVPATRHSVKADYQQDLAWVVPLTLKMGAKHGAYRVSASRSNRYFTWAGPTADGIAPFVGYTFFTGKSDYGPFPFLQTPTTGLPNDTWNNPANWTKTPVQAWQEVNDDLSAYADVKEQVSAGYVQAEAKRGGLRLLAGVRVERTKVTGASLTRRAITTGPNANNAVATLSAAENMARARANWPEVERQEGNYADVLPGVHVVYAVRPGLQARASYNVSITRPNPNEIIPRFVVSETARTLTKGNAELRPYTSDNFEAALQYYFEPIGTLSAGVFLKEIGNYFRSFDSAIGAGPDNGFGGDYEGYTLRQNRNIGRARIRGIELSYAQLYPFLPGPLRGLGSFVNFTYLETKGDFGGTATETRLPNFTPRRLNAGLTYRIRGFDVRVLGNYRGETFIQNLSAGSATTSGTGTGGINGVQQFDTYQTGRLLFDLKTAYTINRVYSVYFDVYNLANNWSLERVVRALGRDMPFQGQSNGRVFHAGVKARF